MIEMAPKTCGYLAAVHEKCRAVPNYDEMLFGLWDDMVTGEVDNSILHFISQTHDGQDYTIYDADVLFFLLAGLQSKTLRLEIIDIGAAPEADENIEGNRAALENLPKEFSVDLWCGNKDSDGYLSWGKHAVPLEIGTTSARTTMRHLCMEFGLARWPYDSSSIIIFHWLKHPANQ